ncbi:uncharacterized protein J3R85_018232 [Psidium guajava]|nr:uncharacterized protein J3R85_018232 [Psidium guajava]
MLRDRSKALLHHFMSCKQAAFVEGRGLCDKANLVHELVRPCPGPLYPEEKFIKADLMKAFESVGWKVCLCSNGSLCWVQIHFGK